MGRTESDSGCARPTLQDQGVERDGLDREVGLCARTDGINFSASGAAGGESLVVEEREHVGTESKESS
jgi:hypothetical protein